MLYITSSLTALYKRKAQAMKTCSLPVVCHHRMVGVFSPFFWLLLPLFFLPFFPRDSSAAEHNAAEKQLVAYSQTQACTQNQHRFFSQLANNSVMSFWSSEKGYDIFQLRQRSFRPTLIKCLSHQLDKFKTDLQKRQYFGVTEIQT